MIRLVIHDPNVPLLLLMYLFIAVFLSERILDVRVADFVFPCFCLFSKRYAARRYNADFILLIFIVDEALRTELYTSKFIFHFNFSSCSQSTAI